MSKRIVENKSTVEMKYDDGKLKAGILFEDFPLALRELVAVCTYGDLKYRRSSWKTVPNAEVRYKDAKHRHSMDSEVEDTDDESELYHLAHEAWNCLATLELKLEKRDKRDYTHSFENARDAKKKQLRLKRDREAETVNTGWQQFKEYKADK